MIGQAIRVKQEQQSLRSTDRLPDGSIKIALGFAFCFIASFIACLCQNLHQAQSGTTLLFDSGHYLETCRLICLYWHQVLTSHHLPAASAKLVDYVMLDGPIFPGFLALVCNLIDKIPTQADWRLFIYIQSFLQATSAGLVYLLGKKFTGCVKWAVVAGLMWGLYPAAIVASQRILSETLATVLLLAIVLLLSRGFTLSRGGVISAVAAGMCNVFLLLTKPPLAFAWLFVNLCAYLQIKKATQRLAFAICVAVGCMIALVPWLAFTYKTSGKVQVIPQRVPAYNMLNGCNLEADGWGAYPANTMISIYPESEGAVPLALGIWRDNPAGSIDLALRKIPRLWSLPWNDFRYKVFGLPITLQEYWHRLLILLGIGGLFAALYGIEAKGVKAKDIGFITAASISVVVGHFAYLPFESLSRYGYTSMPFIALLAAYLLCVVSQSRIFARTVARMLPPAILLLLWSSCDLMPFCVQVVPEARYALWLYYAVCWLLIVVSAFTLWLCLKDMAKAHSAGGQFSVRHWYFFAGCLVIGSLISAILVAHAASTVEVAEWSAKLRAGDIATRQVDLKPINKDVKNLAWALVLIDGDAGLDGAVVEVNGKVVPEKISSVYNYYPGRYQLLNVMQLTAAAFGRSQEDMRQWRAVPVPLSWLDLNGKNTIAVRPGVSGHATIYGEYQMLNNNRRCILSLDYFSHARMWRCTDNLESRILDPVGLPRVSASSWFTTGGRKRYGDLSSAPGVQTGQYRMYFLLGTNHAWAANRLAKRVESKLLAPDKVIFSGNDFQPSIAFDQTSHELTLSQTALKNSPMVVSTVSLPATVTGDSHLQISLKGQAKGSNGPALMNVVAILQGPSSRNTDVVLPATPKAVFVGNSWQDFSVDDVVPTMAALGGTQAIRLELYPQGDLKLKDVTLTVTPEHKPVFAGVNGPACSISIW